jgi:hypothetical protein
LEEVDQVMTDGFREVGVSHRAKPHHSDDIPCGVEVVAGSIAESEHIFPIEASTKLPQSYGEYRALP